MLGRLQLGEAGDDAPRCLSMLISTQPSTPACVQLLSATPTNGWGGALA
jgi:hypothetical protein